MEKWNICSLRANAPFSIMFSKVFKTLLKFFLIFLMLSINKKMMFLSKYGLWSNGLSLCNVYGKYLKLFLSYREELNFNAELLHGNSLREAV